MNHPSALCEEQSSLGCLLKEARKTKGLSEDDLADSLRLDKSIIVKMEEDAYLTQQISVFIRGYFRAYARIVGIPIEKIDAYFLENGFMLAPNIVGPAKFTYKRQMSTKRNKQAVHWATYAVLAGLLILIAAWVYWQRSSDNSNSLTPMGAITAPAHVTAPAASALNTSPLASSVDEQNAQPSTPVSAEKIGD